MLFNLLFKEWEILKNMSLTRQSKMSNWEIKSSYFSLNCSFQEKNLNNEWFIIHIK